MTEKRDRLTFSTAHCTLDQDIFTEEQVESLCWHSGQMSAHMRTLYKRGGALSGCQSQVAFLS